VKIEYKWAVAIVVTVGLFLDLLDMTVINVAIPELARDFQAPPTTIEWVVTGYLLSLAVFVPLSGWAGNRFGTKATFLFALAVFTIGSGLCALANSAGTLIAFRVLQGVGGGMLTPVGTAMLFRAFPPAERSRASAILIVPTSVAPACGPVLGGYLVQYQSWQWIFLINIPIGIVGLAVAMLLLREHREEVTGRFDVPGFVLSGAGLALLLYGLAEAGRHGLDDTRAQAFAAAGVAVLLAFAFVELRTAKPMLNVRLFLDRMFGASNAVMFMLMCGFQGQLFLLPLLLQLERGLTPLESGLTTFPMAVGVICVAPLAGRLYPTVGPRRIMVTGLVLATLNSLAFAWIDLHTALWTIRGIMFIRGIAFGLVLLPLQAATFATISPRDTGEASALFNVVRQVGASFGVAILATVLSRRLVTHAAPLAVPAKAGAALLAFQDTFIFSTGIMVLGVLVAWFIIRDRDAASTMHAHSSAAVH
jgi:EmrB/QacA subfamily drug resistance transporter